MNYNRSFRMGILLLILILIPIPFCFVLINPVPSYILDSIGFPLIVGSISYVWMLFIMYMGTKPRWIDNLIGLPKAYMVHGILSIIVILLAFLHKENLNSSGLIEKTGDISFYIFVAVAAYSAIFLSGILPSRIKIIDEIKNILKDVYIIEYFVNRDIALILHRLNVVAVALVFLHIQLKSHIRENVVFMITLYIYTIPVFLLYFKFIYDNYNSKSDALIVNKKEISKNIYEFSIKTNEKRKFNIGDFVFISVPNTRGLDTPHPFSIVGLPCDNDGNLILAIRGDGDFTRKIQEINTPCKIKISHGFGEYRSIVEKSGDKEIVMIAGGIGITPFISILENIQDKKMKLFYSSSNENNIVYRDKLNKFVAINDNIEVCIKYCRFTVDEILSKISSDREKTIFLLSGPLDMCRFWRRELKKIGVKSKYIFNEGFNW